MTDHLIVLPKEDIAATERLQETLNRVPDCPKLEHINVLGSLMRTPKPMSRH
jgi:hypothetical protein